MKIGDVFVCTELSAKIVSYEKITSARSDENQLAKFVEQGIIGLPFQTRTDAEVWDNDVTINSTNDKDRLKKATDLAYVKERIS